jgi:hypothetical protein
MHAYPGYGRKRDFVGKWWAGMLKHPAEPKVQFFVLDRGVGIPATAPRTQRETLRAYMRTPEQASDDQILDALIREGRTRTGLPQHGKGVASMVALVENRASAGTIEIRSGEAEFKLIKRTGAAKGCEIVATCVRTPYNFRGTLIMWTVGGPT